MKHGIKYRKPVILSISLFVTLIAIITATFLFFFSSFRWIITRNIMKLFAGPDVKLVTIPEGFNLLQVAARLQSAGIVKAEDFLVVAQEPSLLKTIGLSGQSAEGYLFPDTYQFFAGTSPLVIIRTMTGNFRKKFQSLVKKHPDGLKLYENLSESPEKAVVIMASIIQKEIYLKEEAPVIAGIFLKRLRDPDFVPHLLQADPTVAYGCVILNPVPPSCREFNGKVTRQQTKDADNLYNTYIYQGLPPGPICNPGLDCLEAALSPAQTNYLYFVARGDGSHEFSETIEEHNRATQKYRR